MLMLSAGPSHWDWSLEDSRSSCSIRLRIYCQYLIHYDTEAMQEEGTYKVGGKNSQDESCKGYQSGTD